MEIPLLVVAFFALGVMYSILFFVSFIRFFRFRFFSRESWIAKKFYICIFIIEIVRASSFITACLMYKMGISEDHMIAIRGAITGSQTTEEIEYFPKPLFLFLIFPDFLVIIAFTILFWQLLALYNQGHANFFKVVCQGKGKYIIMATIIVLSTVQLLMLGLYSGGKASAKAFVIECTILNFLAATFVWVFLLIYALMYSGSPFRSLAYKVKVRKLTFAVIIWCACRYIRGITGAFEKKCYNMIFRSMINNDNERLAIPIFCILFFLVEEIIPILIVIDWSFMEIFAITGEGLFLRNQAVTGIYDVMRSYEYNEQQSQFNQNYVALNDFSSQLSKSSPDIRIQSGMKMFINRLRQRPTNANANIVTHGFDSKNDSLNSLKNSRTFKQQQAAYNIGQQLLNQSFKKRNSGFQTPQILELSQQSNQLIQLNESQEIVEYEETFHLLVDKKNFSLIKIFDQKLNGLGTLHEAKLNDNIVILFYLTFQVVCRQIQFKRIKEYVIEDFIKEISSFQNIGIKCILPIQGVHFDTKLLSLYIFMPKLNSLFTFLHRTTEITLTSKIKKEVAISIARAIRSLHDRPKGSLRDSEQKYYAHKHLSSHNILLEGPLNGIHNEYKVFIADMESEQLRKYARLFMEYKSMNSWSPPEVMHSENQRVQEIGLSNNTSAISDKSYDQRYIDVFSFGVLLWEIETEQVPFEGMNDSEVKNLVVDQNLRLQIPQKCNGHLAALIRRCWTTKPEKRTNFEYICNHIDKVEFN